MKINLNKLKNFEVKLEDIDNYDKFKKVTHCAISITDAEIWNKGHEDISYPIVLGHEMVIEKNGHHYSAWPIENCGDCIYCQRGERNLCNNLRIIGIHKNGAFSDHLIIPNENLIALPDNLRLPAATFAVPTGRIINMLNKMNLKRGEHILIRGSETMGLLTALISMEYGAIPTVLEKNKANIKKANFFIKKLNLSVIKNIDTSKYDWIINCFPDSKEFISSLPESLKSAQIGLLTDLTKEDMIKGIEIISKNSKPVEMLIEKIISPADVNSVMPSILDGTSYKYIIDFSDDMKAITELLLSQQI